MSVNIDRVCFGVHLFLVLSPPSPYIYHNHLQLHTHTRTCLLLMQLREGKAVAREPKDWSDRFPRFPPRSALSVTTTAYFLSVGAELSSSAFGLISLYHLHTHTPQTHINRVGFFNAFVAAFCSCFFFFFCAGLIPTSFLVSILHAQKFFRPDS